MKHVVFVVMLVGCGGGGDAGDSGSVDARGAVDAPGDDEPREVPATVTGDFATGRVSVGIRIRGFGPSVEGVVVAGRSQGEPLKLDSVVITADGEPLVMTFDNQTEEWSSEPGPLATTYTFEIVEGESSIRDLVFAPAEHLLYATLTGPTEPAPVNQDLVVTWTPSQQIPVEIRVSDLYDSNGVPDTGMHTIPAANINQVGTFNLTLEQEYPVGIAGAPRSSLEYFNQSQGRIEIQ